MNQPFLQCCCHLLVNTYDIYAVHDTEDDIKQGMEKETGKGGRDYGKQRRNKAADRTVRCYNTIKRDGKRKRQKNCKNESDRSPGERRFGIQAIPT